MKIKKKIGYFIKGSKMRTLTLHQHGILTKNSEKFKEQITQNQWKKEQNSTLQISADIRHSDSKSV